MDFGEEECSTFLDAGVDALLPDRSRMASSSYPLKSNFDIRESKGKGLGMFARREVYDGEVILREHPVVVSPYLIGLSMPLADIYADLFKRLSRPAYSELMSLAKSSCPSLKDASVYESIMRANALGIALNIPNVDHAELAIHRGIFLKTSRCNHSCGPNAKWDWDMKTFSLTLTAVRTIAKGQEITIPYIAPDLPGGARRASIQQQYGFECQCYHCTYKLEEDFIHSDMARESLRRAWSSDCKLPSFEKWCTEPAYPDDLLINAYKRSLHLIEAEGLEVLDLGPGEHPERDVGRYKDALAMCYGALEDTENFRIWIAKVRDGRMTKKPTQSLAFNKWLSNPSSFPVWGWRRAICGGGDANGALGLSAIEKMLDGI